MYIFYVLGLCHTGLKVKGTSFCRATFSSSAVQPPFGINFPWSFGNWLLGFPEETISLTVLCAANISSEYQTCTDTTLSGCQFTPWSSGASQIQFCAQRNSPWASEGFEPGNSRTADKRATTGQHAPSGHGSLGYLQVPKSPE